SVVDRPLRFEALREEIVDELLGTTPAERIASERLLEDEPCTRHPEPVRGLEPFEPVVELFVRAGLRDLDPLSERLAGRLLEIGLAPCHPRRPAFGFAIRRLCLGGHARPPDSTRGRR